MIYIVRRLVKNIGTVQMLSRDGVKDIQSWKLDWQKWLLSSLRSSEFAAACFREDTIR